MLEKELMSYKIKSVIIGHAVGDALGVPVEFMTREELKNNPVVGMCGYGTYPMPKGSWSDDTSMSLCALGAFDAGKISFDEVMLNFAGWYFQDLFTPTGVMFDCGNTCRLAIERYVAYKISWKECGLSDERSNGNGSLMRINPFVLYAYNIDTNIRTKIEIIELASGLTHAHPRSKMSCGIYAFVLFEILKSPMKYSIKIGLLKAKEYYKDNPEIAHFARLFSENFERTDVNEIKSSGYVVDSLEAAIWCLFTTCNYQECVLKAVNLGDDTDTVGAIAGGLAGAMYGYESIPQKWKYELIKREYIEDLCGKFANNI